ncbi:hypothetical protein [Larkinella arboricola]
MTKVKRPVVNKAVPVTKSKVAGFLQFGEANLFPQKLLEIAEESVTAGACLDVIAEFIEGNGFNDERLADTVMHRSGLTADDILSETAFNAGTFRVISLHVGYNGLGQISSVKPVNPEMVRLGLPDDLNNITYAGIFPYLDSPLHKNKKDFHTKLNLFDPRPEVVLEQMAIAGGIDKYFGQLVYMPVGRRRGTYYVVPEWYRAILDMQTERKLSVLDYKNGVSGFDVSGIFFALESEEGDEDGSGNDLVSQIEKHQGAENASSVMVYTAKNKEELDAAKFVPTTGADLANRYVSTNDRVPLRIARSFMVANELVNIRRQGGLMYSPEEYRFAAQLMQGRVNRTQRKIEQLFARIFAHWHEPLPFQDFTIENLNYFQENGTVVNAG